MLGYSLIQNKITQQQKKLLCKVLEQENGDSGWCVYVCVYVCMCIVCVCGVCVSHLDDSFLVSTRKTLGLPLSLLPLPHHLHIT